MRLLLLFTLYVKACSVNSHEGRRRNSTTYKHK